MSEVTDDHVVEEHDALSTDTVPEKSEAPKLRPVTVTDDPPVNGTLIWPYEAEGASNEKPSTCVPLSAATVSCVVARAR